MIDSCPVPSVTRRVAVVLFCLLFLVCDSIPDAERFDGIIGGSFPRYGQPLLSWLIDSVSRARRVARPTRCSSHINARSQPLVSPSPSPRLVALLQGGKDQGQSSNNRYAKDAAPKP
jgi:hypothetical protein